MRMLCEIKCTSRPPCDTLSIDAIIRPSWPIIGYISHRPTINRQMLYDENIAVEPCLEVREQCGRVDHV